MASYDLVSAAQAQAEAMGKPDVVGDIHRALAVCRLLGQLILIPGGHIAFLRCDPEHLPLFAERDGNAVLSLPIRELTRGSCIVFLEVLASSPGVAYRAIRQIMNASGCTIAGAWRTKGDHWTMRRIRRGANGRRVQQEQIQE